MTTYMPPPAPDSAPTPTAPQPQWSRNAALGLAAVAVCAGIVAGVALGGNQDPKVETRTETVATVPDSCNAAISAAANALEANIRWREAAKSAMSAAGDGFGAISDLDVDGLNAAAARVSAQQPFIEDAQNDIDTYEPQFLAQAEACRGA